MEESSDPRGALVRPYAVTRGRTEPARDIPMDAMLETTFRGRQEARYAGRDKHLIASLCDRQAQSLAEVAALMHLPLGVARVLVSDMAVDGLLAVHQPAMPETEDDRLILLERVLSGLRRL